MATATPNITSPFQEEGRRIKYPSKQVKLCLKGLYRSPNTQISISVLLARILTYNYPYLDEKLGDAVSKCTNTASIKSDVEERDNGYLVATRSLCCMYFNRAIIVDCSPHMGCSCTMFDETYGKILKDRDLVISWLCSFENQWNKMFGDITRTPSKYEIL